MKLMFVSDIHGSYDSIRRIIDIFNKEKMDKLIILGDILYHGPRNPLPEGHNPKEVAILLNEYKDKIIAVRGNCDAEVDQMVLEFDVMATYTRLYIDNRCFFLTHGHHYDRTKLPSLNKGDVFVYGHYHIPELEEQDGIVIVNPNSISLPKKGDKGYAVYENGEIILYNLDEEVLKRKKL